MSNKFLNVLAHATNIMEHTAPTSRNAGPTPPLNTVVYDADGQQARLTAIEENNGTNCAILQQDHGETLRLPQDMLEARSDGSYSVPLTFSAIDQAAQDQNQQHIIPVIQEELQVSKRTVDTGRGIRVQQHVVERTEVVDEPLHEDVLEVTRVPIGSAVDRDNMPQPRQEGETFIVPVLEEILVVERQLRLKEEVHITRHKREVHAPQTVVLKSQEISIEHFDENANWRGTTTMPNNPKENTNNPGTSAG